MRRACVANCPPIASSQRRAFIGGMFGKGKANENKEPGANSDKSEAGPSIPGLGNMAGFNPKMMKEFMSQPADKQVDMMRAALDMQKKFGGSIPGLGKVNAKNVEFMENMINKMDPRGAKPSSSSEGASPSAPPATSSPKPSSPNSFRSPSGPTLEELRKINLGAEIEELFAELGSMRTKRNHYRAELEKMETQLTTSQKETDEYKAKSADLRARLGASENTIRIMNTESLQQKSSLQSLKAVQEENKRLNIKVSALQSNDTVPLKENIASLEAELGNARDTIRGLQRKLDRMRKRDVMAQFSLLLTDIRASTSVAETSDKHHSSTHDAAAEAHRLQDDAYHSELFESLQERYDAGVTEAWAACATKATLALLASCEGFIQNCLGRGIAKLDAHVTLDPSRDQALVNAVATAKGYEVSTLEDGSFLVTAPANAASPALLGPFGFFAAYAHELGNTKTSVRPYISDALAHNTKRATTSTSTTRSSGPGGQAANTAETQVSITFSVDGERLFVSEAQDTRSQLANKVLAEDRLFAEKLSHYNKKVLSQVRLDTTKWSSNTGNPVTPDRWADTTAALEDSIAIFSAADQSVIRCARKAITGHN